MKSKAHGILHDEAVQLFVAIDPVVAAIALLPQPSRYFAPVIWRHRCVERLWSTIPEAELFTLLYQASPPVGFVLCREACPDRPPFRQIELMEGDCLT